jgi:hypothetical protein
MHAIHRTTATAVVLLAVLAIAGCGGDSRASAVKPYPLTTCIVTGNALGSMGDEQTLIYEGRELKFCCAPCIEKFKANPQRYLAKLP